MAQALLIRQLQLGELGNFTYIIADPASKEAFVIDPSAPPAGILGPLKKEGLTLKGILLTHGHYDHVVDTGMYDVPVYLSRAEAVFYTPAAKNLVRTADAEKIALGALTVECLHTPGHTPGCQCFYIDGNIFTGDVLFVDAVGRTDFPGGSADTLFESLQRLKRLPGATVIWPGHHYGRAAHASIAALRRSNPFFACDSLAEFREYTG
ncbi:MAG: MBL fold metallo-hydrolase [Candidatus Omnitrophota bacterium]